MRLRLWIFFLSFFILFSLRSKAQILFKLINDSLYNYSYAGGDEFNASKINQNDWRLVPWPRTTMGQFFAYDDRNTTINDGVAEFLLNEKDSIYTISPVEIDSGFVRRSKITSPEGKYKMKYRAGIIISNQKYHYGLYELRFKVEEGKGVWPAFWFHGGYKNEEIDAFELKGEKNNKIHVDTHCPYGCDNGYKNKLGLKTNFGNWMPVKNYLHDGFNIMLLEWKKDEVIWYINGYPLAYFKGAFPNPMNMYINTQVSSNFSAFQPAPDKSTVFPNTFYVDYLRVWKKDSIVRNLKLNSTANFKTSNRFKSDYRNFAKRHMGLMYNRKKFKAEDGLVSLTLTREHVLDIKVLGKLNHPKTRLQLKGSFATYEITYPDFEKEIAIDSREKEFELILSTRLKEYHRKIKLVSL